MIRLWWPSLEEIETGELIFFPKDLVAPVLKQSLVLYTVVSNILMRRSVK